MSEVLQVPRPPEADANPDPLILSPVDLGVIEFLGDLTMEGSEDVVKKGSPVSQKKLAENIQRGNDEAKQDATARLLEINNGLIATIVYRHCPSDAAIQKFLLKKAQEAVIKAAITYDLSPDGPYFEDHAVPLIEDAIIGASDDAPERHFASEPEKRPMEGVLRFVVGLKEASSPLTRQRSLQERERNATEDELADTIPEALSMLTPRERKVLPWLHLLTSAEIANKTDILERDVETAVTLSKRKLGGNYPTRTALVLEFHKRGFQFAITVPKKPLGEILDEREFAIARSLDKLYTVIGQKHSLCIKQINCIVNEMISKTGARTRSEFALMVQEYDMGEQGGNVSRLNPASAKDREQIAA
ncbi:hypothetical protein KY385_04045 [Candidatus Parcubacteria bacterium]|nr:hypothetical protein [Candidatus Parcubacteria bacterium]